MADTIKFSVVLDGKELDFVNKLLKSYEGLVFVTVIGIEDEVGKLELEVTKGTKEDVIAILEDLKTRMDLKIINDC